MQAFSDCNHVKESISDFLLLLLDSLIRFLFPFVHDISFLVEMGICEVDLGVLQSASLEGS